MEYLFTYNYEAKKDEGCRVNGSGSSTITAEGTNKVTYSMIFGVDGAISMAEKCLKEQGLYDIKVAPMGWFKFDK